VGQDEDPLPLVRRADFCRAEQTRRRRVTQFPKLSQDGFQAEGDVARNVFEEHPCGAAFCDDAGDIGPEVAGISGPAALSGRAERLARIPGEDGVKDPSGGRASKLRRSSQIGAGVKYPARWAAMSTLRGQSSHSTKARV